MNPNRWILKHTIITIKRQWQRESWKQQKKNVRYKAASIKPSADFSAETLHKDQKEVGQYMQSAEKNNYQPKVLYLAKLTFKNEEEIRTSKYKQKADSLSLLDLPYKKCKRKSFNLKKKRDCKQYKIMQKYKDVW